MAFSYIAKNLDELFEKSPPEIQAILDSGEVDTTTAILGKVYKIPVSSYLALSNLISFILIGALQPENVLQAFEEMLSLTPDDAYKLAQDLDKSILEKARIKILGKTDKDMVTLSFVEGRTPDELRKEILDTTKRESAITKEQVTEPTPRKPFVITPGSRSQLIDQLQILDAIPNDEEIAARLSHIQEQIAGIDKKDSRALDSNVPLEKFMLGAKSDEVAPPPKEEKAATYSRAPTKYNVDPYREVFAE
jgi:hypothetical protein